MALLLRFDDSVDIDHPLYARFADVTAGTAGPCPECDRDGVVYSVERATFAQNQRCPGCGYRWQFRFDPSGRITEVRELSGDRLDLLAPSPLEVGDVLDLRDDRDPAGSGRTIGRWWRRSHA